ncbi:phosphohistidine phosphatase [Sarotherodon galilaeus]
MVRVTSGQKSLSTSTSTKSPVNRPTKLLPIDELFLFLNYLATGCTQRELCHKFNIHRATVSRILVSWPNFLYTLLGSVSIWMAPYKSHSTFKALIGMSHHGALTFEIFRHSGITSLLTPEMDIMVDKGFLVDELMPGKVHRPAFLSKQAQMSELDVLRTQSIARLRVHVERLIRRVKENKLFDTVIPLSISGSINQIFTVACLLTNYQYGPLVKKWVVD